MEKIVQEEKTDYAPVIEIIAILVMVGIFQNWIIDWHYYLSQEDVRILKGNMGDPFFGRRKMRFTRGGWKPVPDLGYHKGVKVTSDFRQHDPYFNYNNNPFFRRGY